MHDAIWIISSKCYIIFHDRHLKHLIHLVPHGRLLGYFQFPTTTNNIMIDIFVHVYGPVCEFL